jgi:hypothetical protein
MYFYYIFSKSYGYQGKNVRSKGQKCYTSLFNIMMMRYIGELLWTG